jgi:hypothetical protein
VLTFLGGNLKPPKGESAAARAQDQVTQHTTTDKSYWHGCSRPMDSVGTSG